MRINLHVDLEQKDFDVLSALGQGRKPNVLHWSHHHTLIILGLIEKTSDLHEPEVYGITPLGRLVLYSSF